MANVLVVKVEERYFGAECHSLGMDRTGPNRATHWRASTFSVVLSEKAGWAPCGLPATG
jgi:hypothetical protein